MKQVVNIQMTGSVCSLTKVTKMYRKLEMKTHETVMIYQDPITELKPEGKAVLLHKEADLGQNLEQWKVCFEGEDGAVYLRTIKVN